MHEVLKIHRPECGALFQEDGSVRWRVWAPQGERLDLTLLEGDKWMTYAMKREEHGYFSFEKEQIGSGQRYAYRVNGGAERPDPDLALATGWRQPTFSRAEQSRLTAGEGFALRLAKII